MNGRNQRSVNYQTENSDHSTFDDHLIRYADGVANIMKNSKRYSFSDTQKTHNHRKKINTKRRWFCVAIVVITVVLAITLATILLLVNNDHPTTTSSPPDPVLFIRDGLNTSVAPCNDFYGHVCSSHKSSSYDHLLSQFYHLIIPAISNDMDHPEVAKTLLHFIEACAKVNGGKTLLQDLVQQNMNSVNLPYLRSKMVDKNFNFMVPLVRILFHSPTLNTKLLHRIFFDNNTIAFYGDSESSRVTYKPWSFQNPLHKELETFEKFYNYYLTMFNTTKNEEELTALQRFAREFELICNESISNGLVSNTEIVSLRNVHFKEAVEEILPYLFLFDRNNTSISGSFQVSVDQVMIDSLQQLFESHPSEGLLFLRVVAISVFNAPNPPRTNDTIDSLRQLCFYGILSSENFAIFNSYAANLVLRADFRMTQDRDQLLLKNMTEKIRQRIRAKLSATVWLQNSSESEQIIDRLMDTTLVVGLPESAAKNEVVSEIDRFETFLSLHKDRKDSRLLVRLANSRLKRISEFWPDIIPNAYTRIHPNYTTIELSHVFLQRPFFATEFPESYNYGFTGKAIGHEYFHQLMPGHIAMLWRNNTRYIECVGCYAEFYDGICFNLTLTNNITNATGMHKVCAKGLTDHDENIPDVEGTRVAFEAMKEVLGEDKLKERAMPEFDYTNEQMFFVAAAQLHCNKKLNDHEYLANNMLNEDPHGSGNVRVNAIAMQMAEFAEAFQCQPGDAMVTTEKKMCYFLPTV